MVAGPAADLSECIHNKQKRMEPLMGNRTLCLNTLPTEFYQTAADYDVGPVARIFLTSLRNRKFIKPCKLLLMNENRMTKLEERGLS